MTLTKDKAALNDWYVVGISTDITRSAPRRTRLLGQDIRVTRAADGAVGVTLTGGEEDGRAARAEEHYGFIWTTFGAPNRGIFPLAEAFERDRRVVTCGTVDVAA